MIRTTVLIEHKGKKVQACEMITCKSCGASVPDTMTKCPKCGRSPQ